MKWTIPIALVVLSMLALPAAANTQTGSGFAAGFVGDCVTVNVQPETGFELTSPDNGDWDIFFDDGTTFATLGDEAGTVPAAATSADVCAWSSETAPNAPGTVLIIIPGETSFEYTDGL